MSVGLVIVLAALTIPPAGFFWMRREWRRGFSSPPPPGEWIRDLRRYGPWQGS